MPTAKQYLRLAEQAEADAAKLEARAVHDREQARVLRELAAREATREQLHNRGDLSILDKPMEDAHRLAISRGRSSSRMDPDFKTAYRSKGHTLTTLAAAVGCDAPLLSKYRRKLRRIPQDRAEKIAKLIPWAADLKHWPGGIVPKD